MISVELVVPFLFFFDFKCRVLFVLQVIAIAVLTDLKFGLFANSGFVEATCLSVVCDNDFLPRTANKLNKPPYNKTLH